MVQKNIICNTDVKLEFIEQNCELTLHQTFLRTLIFRAEKIRINRPYLGRFGPYKPEVVKFDL